jgi:hypothetical protein
VRKWPVLPVSAIVLMMMFLLGGPSFEDENGVDEIFVIKFDATNAMFLFWALGSPPSQADAGRGVDVVGAGVGSVAFRLGGTNTCVSPRLRWIMLLPPSILVKHASCRCPGAGPIHV